MNELLKLLAERMRMRRKMQEIKLKNVAKKIGVSGSYISAIENGRCRISLEMYLALCKEYHLDPGKFLNAVIKEYKTGIPQMPIMIYAKLRKEE